MSKRKQKLNREQLKAVRHRKGPLLIIAGAGTGKTTVVTERIKYLIEKELAKPSEILALTFTEKAAREMEERVDVAMPYGYTQMWISTFHSFCDRILRREALSIGFNPKYKLMTQAETVQFIRNNLFKFKLDYFRPLGNPTKFVDGMVQHFSRLQDEDIGPSEYSEWVQTQKSKLKSQNNNSKAKKEEEGIEIKKWEELANAYKVYEELKVKEGVMDFGDLIVKTLKLFRDRPNVLKQYKKQFKYILVDEFQDTNFAQNELAVLLAGEGKNANITVTGDDDQSIYRFRGAAVSNIIQFRKNYPKARAVVLAQNYRSTQEILDKSYDLIQHNNPDRLEVVENVDKKLKSQKKDGEKIGMIHKNRVENEAESVAKEIRRLVDDEEYDLKNVAILVRANNHSEPFIRAFQRFGIPYQFLGPGRLFKQPEIVDLISYLKVLYDFDDSVAFYRLLSFDYFNISSKDLIRLGNYAKRLNLSLFEASGKIEDVYVSDETKRKIKKIVKILNRHFDMIKKETAGQLLYYFLEDTGLLQKLLNPDTSEAEKKAKNISKFFDKLKTYEVDHEDATVAAVVDWIDLSSELGESPLAADTDWTDVNAVNILTVHSAKGLEFPVVFLVNLVSQRFPTRERREQIPIPEELIKEVLPKGDHHEQEERRLFYVGMTRARDRLYFTAADYYGEGKREKRLSPFIFEALGDEATASEIEAEKGEQLSFLDYRPPSTDLTSETEEKQPLHIDYLSYSQIATFQVCPLHYKLKYILRIPTPPSAAQSFGISMHAAMKDFYAAVKTGDKPSHKLLLEMLGKNWVQEGYKSKSHERKTLKAGESYLRKYYQKSFDRKNLPLALEESFTVPLTPAKGKKRLRIGGKIDRVDGNNGKIEIIDYKTGERIPTQKQVDNDLQLTFYALAAASIKETPFGKKPGDIKLSLYYFDGQQKITTTRTKQQLIEAEKEIYEWREKIENSDFTCSNHFFCQNCEYKIFCGVNN
jgi:DNA helicase-2/ATP-dependent DNA helicase PcrA